MPARYVVNHEHGWAVKNKNGKRALKRRSYWLCKFIKKYYRSISSK